LDKILDLKSLNIEAVRLSRANEKGLITQSLSTYSQEDKYVVIDCDWSLGLNQKTTTLCFSNGDIILDHSNERVMLKQNAQEIVLKSLKNNNSRLVNHYLRLFLDFAEMYKSGNSNFENAYRIHEKYFEVMEYGCS